MRLAFSFFPFQIDVRMAQIQQFIRSLATANPQQREQLLQRVPLQKRAQVLMRAQQIRQQLQQQQQQQQQLGDRTGSVPGQSGVGMGQNQPGMNVLPDQQRQQQLIGGGVGDPFSVLAVVY